MTELFAIRYITLRPNVTAQAFVAMIEKTLTTLPAFPQMGWLIAQGDRGDRAGQFALIYQYQTAAVRDRLGPDEVTLSTEALAYLAEIGDFLVEVDKYGNTFGELILYTDYPAIAEF